MQRKRGVLYSATERCQSGRMCRSRKAVRCKPSWVRIPLSPLLEEPHSGLVSTTGNRVRCKPPWVRIPPPPPKAPIPSHQRPTPSFVVLIIHFLTEDFASPFTQYPVIACLIPSVFVFSGQEVARRSRATTGASVSICASVTSMQEVPKSSRLFCNSSTI